MKRAALALLVLVVLVAVALLSFSRWAETDERECLQATHARFVEALMAEPSEARARDKVISTAERLGYEPQDCRGEGLELECSLPGYCGVGSSLGSTVCFVFDAKQNLLSINASACGAN